MTKKNFIRSCLIVTICTLAFAGYASAFAGQAPKTGKIVGRVVERNSKAPLAAEIGVLTQEGKRLSFKHINVSNQGEFVIDGLGAGEIHLTTKLEGYAAEHQSVNLREGENQKVDFSLTKFKIIRGIILGPAGLPIAGANIRVLYPANATRSGAIQATYQWESVEFQTDEQGAFALEVHPDKFFVVEASHQDFLGIVSSPARIKHNESEASITLAFRQSVSVAGEIKDEDGNVVQDAQVRLIEAGRRSEYQGFVSHEQLKQKTRYTTSNADGKFTFDQVKPTRKMLVIIHPIYHSYRELVDLTKSKGQHPVIAVLRNKNKPLP